MAWISRTGRNNWVGGGGGSSSGSSNLRPGHGGSGKNYQGGSQSYDSSRPYKGQYDGTDSGSQSYDSSRPYKNQYRGK